MMTDSDETPLKRQAHAPAFLKGGGEMGGLMRARDWSKSSLGPAAAWPQALRTAIRLMLNTGHPMYIWWGREGLCFYNDAYRQSIGPERHPGSLGLPVREVWAEIWDIIGPQIEQVMEGRGATWHENHLVPITRNGKREDVYWTYSFGPIDDETASSGVGGVLVVCTETTQQVLSLRRSSEELARFAVLFEQAPSFMAMLRGPEHRIELANPGYIRLVGNRNVVGRTVAEALPEAVEQGYVQLLDDVYRGGEAYTATGAKFVMQSNLGGAGEERIVDFVYQPIKDNSGDVIGIFVEGIDVTERASADLALQRLAAIVESSDDAIISKNVDGTILSWNRGAERLFGYTADEMLGKSITLLIPSSLENEEPNIIGRILKGERVDHYETVRRRKDGSLVHVSLTVSPIRDRTGKIVGASKVGRDITESKTAAEKQTLLVREMNHRIKNLFAVASGVVSVSARSATTPKDLASAVLSRMGALARAHDLLLPTHTQASENGKARFAELLRTILSPYDAGHISTSGPDIEIGSKASTSFALLLHEFATNSVKYGALSKVSGHIDINWTSDDNLTLNWTESGGPSTHPPSEDKNGFGGVLVKATVEGLGGRLGRDWRATGLSIRLTVPIDRIAN